MDIGYWILSIGCWVLNKVARNKISDGGHRVQKNHNRATDLSVRFGVRRYNRKNSRSSHGR
ncbi:MAG: hypothetical protein DWQ10_15615 [Calditrichaeota bacterium]|nr:MAG: hypothetical protein DWQ10_15615 [Calditrichota bacterium]